MKKESTWNYLIYVEGITDNGSAIPKIKFTLNDMVDDETMEETNRKRRREADGTTNGEAKSAT